MASINICIERPGAERFCDRPETILTRGGRPLRGELRVQGAKNSTLPLLAAAVVCRGETVLHNCPELSDVGVSVRILRRLGCRCVRRGKTLLIRADGMSRCDIPHNLMREMRSSIVFLGAILARAGEASLSFPGGCEIGPRPIDLHLSALEKLGVEIREEHGCLLCRAPKGIRGGFISLAFPSVGATENLLLAAATGHGTTVMPDRIVAATYMAAAAVTGGTVLLKKVNAGHLLPVLSAFEETGCRVMQSGDELLIRAPERLKPVRHVRTMPYPGFPTDAQAPVMAMAALGDGTSIFVENIFESRYKHAGELNRLGAKIKVEGKVAVIEGVPALSGAPVSAQDLRGGAALVAAGLAAQGETQIMHPEYIDRGYERFEENLRSLGAEVYRI